MVGFVSESFWKLIEENVEIHATFERVVMVTRTMDDLLQNHFV